VKSTPFKALLEVFLIVFSVMLAFYLDNLRQDANDKKALLHRLATKRQNLNRKGAQGQGNLRIASLTICVISVFGQFVR
jgi:hypothetical protein